MHFEFYPVRLHFRALAPVYFPSGKAGNILRGRFGASLKQTASAADYARIFEPRPSSPGPSGFADLPRPFVFRAAHLDGQSFHAGDEFHFDLHLFDLRDPGIVHFANAFAGMGWELVSASSLNDASQAPSPMCVSLLPGDAEIRKIRVMFQTPTELKQGSEILRQPTFATLFARARDRVSSLSQYYGHGPLPIDFRETNEHAAKITMTAHEFHHVEVERTSRRTGQTHSLGGIVGEATYEGELKEFVPYLQAAKWTGVGRQTVWGKGQIEVEFR